MKLYEDHAVITKSFRKIMPLLTEVLIYSVLFVPFFAVAVVLIVLGGLIYFLSLGHLHLFWLGIKLIGFDDAGIPMPWLDRLFHHGIEK